MGDKEKTEIIGKYFENEYLIISLCLEFLSKAPSNLTTDDLEDFCALAHHYASNTPQSFRKVLNQTT